MIMFIIYVLLGINKQRFTIPYW